MTAVGHGPSAPHFATVLVLLALATTTSCAAGPGAGSTATGHARAASDAPQGRPGGWRALVRDDHGPPPKPWGEMTGAERKAYMRDVVVPTLEPLFLAYDAERFASFGCRTCHGASARQRAYAMPSPELFALHPSGTPEQKRLVEEKEEAARFMFNAVTPTMRQLLGAQPYDAATATGFSCFSCHPNGQETGETQASGVETDGIEQAAQ